MRIIPTVQTFGGAHTSHMAARRRSLEESRHSSRVLPTPPRNEHQSKVASIKDRWEQCQLADSFTTTTTTPSARESPTLTQLKTNSSGCPGEGKPFRGSTVYAAQQELVRKHHEAKSRIGGISGLGGGISMWPAMDDMRLSWEDTARLVAVCVTLVVVTMATFHWFHGDHITKLQQYTSQLDRFHSLPASSYSDQELFDQQLMSWHLGFLQLQESIHNDFDVVWSGTSLTFLILYICGIIALLYFLVDNMFSTNRLTPRRIKIWISLLCVVMTWTLLSVYLLVRAQALERATQNVVLSLNNDLADLIQTPLDLTQYHGVLLYWRTRCLPPTARGVLSIMGLVQVQDLAYYLQYYSLPIITAICTPIVKIIMSLRTVYKV